MCGPLLLLGECCLASETALRDRGRRGGRGILGLVPSKGEDLLSCQSLLPSDSEEKRNGKRVLTLCLVAFFFTVVSVRVAEAKHCAGIPVHGMRATGQCSPRAVERM